MLQVRDLRTSILKPASFSLSAGEALAVRGPSGAGKTLLLRAVADLDPNEGLVTLDGRDRSGYGSRLVSGYLGDRTGKYWAVTIAGYLLNLFAVPLLALAGAWQIAVVLIIAERMGRGIRSPVRDAMLSHAASRTGLGWGFGLHQALDQLGAVAGPLVVSGVLFVGGGYQAAFGWLLIPAVLSMAVLLAARYLFPRPHDFELAAPLLEGEDLAPIFWVY